MQNKINQSKEYFDVQYHNQFKLPGTRFLWIFQIIIPQRKQVDDFAFAWYFILFF